MPMAMAIIFARVMSPLDRPSSNQIISEFQTPLQNAATLEPKIIVHDELRSSFFYFDRQTHQLLCDTAKSPK